MIQVAFLHVDDKSKSPQPQRRLAQIMISSVKEVIPDPWLIQMTDFETPILDGVDESRRLELSTPHFMTYRLRHLTRIKGEVLILDTDTVVLKDPSKVFEIPFDVALTNRAKHIISKSRGYTMDDPIMEYNTGVMFSRCPAFFSAALADCMKLEDRHQRWFGDQIAVMNVVNTRQFNVAVLPCEKWNYSPEDEQESLHDRCIVHYKGGKRKQWMLNHEKQPYAA